MNWLNQLNPNVLAGMFTVLTTLAGWLWHKARGEKTDSFNTIISGVLRNFTQELLDQYSNEDIASYLKTSRDYIEQRAWGVLVKRGVPKNALTQTILHGLIEHATADLAEQIAERKLPSQLDAISEAASGVRAAWEAAEARGKANVPGQDLPE